MNYGSNVLKTCAVLASLLTGTAYSEPQANKPYRVCPEEFVTAKDAPCRIIGPSAAIVNRIEVPNTDKKKIRELEEKIKILEDENAALKAIDSNKNKPKVDIDKPTATRSIRG